MVRFQYYESKARPVKRLCPIVDFRYIFRCHIAKAALTYRSVVNGNVDKKLSVNIRIAEL